MCVCCFDTVDYPLTDTYSVIFLSLAALLGVPSSIWPKLATLKPPAPHAKLAIVFAAWHVALVLYLFLAPFFMRRRSKARSSRRSSTDTSDASSKTA
jgi:hypothetical protein